MQTQDVRGAKAKGAVAAALSGGAAEAPPVADGRGSCVREPRRPSYPGMDRGRRGPVASAGRGRPAPPGDAPPDFVLLDASLPSTSWVRSCWLGPAKDSVGPRGDGTRPALLVFVPAGRPAKLERRLREHADDFVIGGLGDRGGARAPARRGCASAASWASSPARRRAGGPVQPAGRLGPAHGRRAAARSNVQRSLLPSPVQHGRLEIAREFIPFREIGGDYYDFIGSSPTGWRGDRGRDGQGRARRPHGREPEGLGRAQVQGGDTSPEDLTPPLNRLFWDVTPQGLFCSLFFAVFDLERGVLANVQRRAPLPLPRPARREDPRPRGGRDGDRLRRTRATAGHRSARARRPGGWCSTRRRHRPRRREGELFGVERLKGPRCAAAPMPRGSCSTAPRGRPGLVRGDAAEDDSTLIVASVPDHARVPMPDGTERLSSRPTGLSRHSVVTQRRSDFRDSPRVSSLRDYPGVGVCPRRR